MDSKNELVELGVFNLKVSKLKLRMLQLLFSITALGGVILFIVKHL